MAKTVVGLYDNYADAQSAYQELAQAGFDRRNISIVASDVVRHPSAVVSELPESGSGSDSDVAQGAGAGALAGGITGLIIGLAALAVPGIGPVLAIGPLAGLLGGAAVGLVVGGILGGLIDVGVPRQYAEYYAEGVRRGGTLVTVQTEDSNSELAMDILDRHNAIDVEERAAQWRQAGWSTFNPAAAPYTADQIAQERARYGVPAGEPTLPADTLSATTPAYQAGVPVPPVSVAPANVTTENTVPAADVPNPTAPNPPAQVGRRPLAYDYSGTIHPVEDEPPMAMDSVPTDRELIGAKGGEVDATRPGTRPGDYQNSDLAGDVDPFDPLTRNP